MAKIFVHGNPEVAAVWRLLHAALDDRVSVCASFTPPGFGRPAPLDFVGTPADYVEWLVEEVEGVGAPVDIVGHDWGAGHVMGLVAARPDLVNTWAIDCAGLFHPDYQWHDRAQVWQTPGEGEAATQAALDMTVEDRSTIYGSIGLPDDIARAMAEGYTADMCRCMLALYRGAVQPFLADLGERLAGADLPPGLILDATADPYVPSEFAPSVANRFGAMHHRLEGHGHWWMTSAPEEAADALVEFWNLHD